MTTVHTIYTQLSNSWAWHHNQANIIKKTINTAK